MGFVVKKSGVGQIFLRLLQFPYTRIIQPMLHKRLYLHVTLTRGNTGNMRINLTLRRVRITIVAVEKQ